VTSIPAVLVLVLAGAALVALGARALFARQRESRWGRFVAADLDDGSLRPLVSERYRLVGRPDALRRTGDGRLVPVELKHRPAPDRGPFRSHRVQLWAYCLLLEETEGRSPPFGILRYRDREYRIPWDEAARTELGRLLAAVNAPYDGRATPSAARCTACRWRSGCDARAEDAARR